MMPYVTEALIGGATISLGSLPFFETVDGVAVENAGELLEADQADQYVGSCGAWVTKFGLTFRFNVPRYTAELLAAAMNLSVAQSGQQQIINLNPAAYVPQYFFRMLATRADGLRVTFECPAVIVLGASGAHTIGRNAPATIALEIKTCIDDTSNPSSPSSQGKITFERIPV
jgi:hypothetical protein